MLSADTEAHKPQDPVTAVRSPDPGPRASFRCHRRSLLVKSHGFDQLPFPFRLKLNTWSGRLYKKPSLRWHPPVVVTEATAPIGKRRRA